MSLHLTANFTLSAFAVSNLSYNVRKSVRLNFDSRSGFW